MEIGVYSFVERTPDPATGATIGAPERIADLLEEIALADEVGLDVFGIGEHHRAEYLAYLNCAMDRPSFDRAVEEKVEPYRFIDRISGLEVQLGQEDFDDLCRVHFYDWLEQVPRSQEWDYRRAAYRRMAERLGTTAEANFERVYSQESMPAQVDRLPG